MLWGSDKSTLAYHRLPHPDVRIPSDDTPFIDRRGRALSPPAASKTSANSPDCAPVSAIALSA